MMQKMYQKSIYWRELKNINPKILLFVVLAQGKSKYFLTYYGLDHNILKFITDNSKYKQNKLTPVSENLIKNDDALKVTKIYCVILSWNISSLIKKNQKINKNIKFLYI